VSSGLRRPIPLWIAVLVIAVSAPFALAFETLFRTEVLGRVLGPDLGVVRDFFSPTLTEVAWWLAGLTLAAGLVGVAILPWSLRRAEIAARASGRDMGDAARRSRAIERLFLLTSIPQVPAILATFSFTFGSRLAPVIVAMAISTIFVVAQGLVAARLLRRIPAAS
jgi:hypothetical protein